MQDCNPKSRPDSRIENLETNQAEIRHSKSIATAQAHFLRLIAVRIAQRWTANQREIPDSDDK